MKRTQRSGAAALSFILAFLAPGLPSYAAVGQSLSAASNSGARAPAAVSGAVPRGYFGLSLMPAGGLSLGLQPSAVFGNIAPGGVRGALEASAPAVSAALAAQAAAALSMGVQGAEAAFSVVGLSPAQAPASATRAAQGLKEPAKAQPVQVLSSLRKLGGSVADGARAESALRARYENAAEMNSPQAFPVLEGFGSSSPSRLLTARLDPSPRQGDDAGAPKAPEGQPNRLGPALWISLGAALVIAAYNSPIASPQLAASAALYLGLAIPSFVLHEMGHAWVASRLGDYTAREQGRLSFKWKDLVKHVDPFWTLFFPLWTILLQGFAFGMAKPVEVDSGRMWRAKSWVHGLMLTAVAGPAVNLGLAAVFGLLHAAAVWAGAHFLATGLALAVFVNVLLFLFNLFMPFYPADGHHVVRYLIVHWLKWPHLAQVLDSAKVLQIGAFVGAMLYFQPYLMAAVQAVSSAILFAMGGFLFPPAAGAQLASAALPALAALGLLVGSVRSAAPFADQDGVFAEQEVPDSVALIVRLPEGARPLSDDLHLHWVDTEGPSGVQRHFDARARMLSQLAEGGLDSDTLDAYGATPLATYQKINMTTLKVPAPRAAALRAALEARGFKVFANDRIEIIRPIEPDPIQLEAAGGAVKMPDALRISGAQKVHERARKLWGPRIWETGAVGGLVLGLLNRAADVPQPPVAVLDSGADTAHKLLKRGVRQVKNMTRAPNEDDIGHGTWVTGMLLFFAGWLRNVTHYKTFVNGGGSLDDMLKAMTEAAKDGNIILSNSWGSDRGDPESPDSQMALALAKEGRIVVFAAGNNGQEGKDTIGSPAIMFYRDPQTGAPRILSIASTDRTGRRSYFSSLGLGSPVTSRGGKYRDWPRRPDAAGVGQDIEGPWPGGLKSGRVDPALGPLKAISGTSMITPQFPGAIALLAMLFGVTTVGEKLDKIVLALMETLTNEHKQGEDAVGKGFYAVDAAYARAVELGLKPVAPAGMARFALRLAGRLL